MRIVCSSECCGNSLVAEHRDELEEPGNNLVAGHRVEMEEPGNKLVAEHRVDLWEQLVRVELGEQSVAVNVVGTVW